MKYLLLFGLFGLCCANAEFGGLDEDFALLMATKDMKNTTDFCQLLDMDQHECELMLTDSPDIDENGDKIVVSGGERSEIAMFDACNPRMSTITIPRHPDPDITVWPTCTRAMRCGGCCTSDVFSCEPTESKPKYVKVFDTRLPYVGAHRFQFLGVRTIKILEHVQCDARCKTKPHECHKYQIYESRKCRCVCHPNRLKLMSTCNSEQRWDDTECDCICPNRNTVKCPEPSYFSTTTCKCTLKTEVGGEIDLDLLFHKLDKTIIDLFSFENNIVDGKVEIGVSEIENHNGDDDQNSDTDDVSTSMTSSTTEEPTSSTSTTPSTTTTTVTTQSTTTTAKKDPCENFKCIGTWIARQLRSGRCFCFPPLKKN
ncbi:hypothetical protein ACF0H5_010502 [Mactra antiquata]